MLFRETVAVYCENRTEHTNTLSGQTAEISNAKAGGMYDDHCLKLLVLHLYMNIPWVIFQLRIIPHGHFCYE
jgi:hypothetical protein